jgi:hypothetical protein
MSEEKTDAPRQDILHDRFVRWQTTAREQLSYAINLILVFSGATIGFEITTSLNERFVLSRSEDALYLTSLLFLALSMIPGLAAVISRLRDFRATTKIARLRWKSRQEDAAEIDLLVARTISLGRITWCLFYVQIIAFAIGAFFAATVFFLFIASQPG